MNISLSTIKRHLRDCYGGVSSATGFDFPISDSLGRYWPSDGVASSTFQTRFPDPELLVRMGRRAVKRRIRYWHPWHMEQTHVEYALSKDIDWFTPPNGDHEWIESLVRFDHMIDLAAAHELTKEKRFARSFADYLKSFSESRSVPGRHWKFRLNPAIRVINLIRAYDLIARSLPSNDAVHLLVSECILTDIEFLKTQVDDVSGNGAFFVVTAILIATLYYEKIFDTCEWKNSAELRFFEILQTEIQDDGFEAEQVPMYHGEVLLTLLDYCVALTSNGRSIDPRLRVTMRRMLAAIGRVSDPQGMIPPIGDSDRFDVRYLYDFSNTVLNECVSLERDWSQSDANSSRSGALFEVQELSATGWIVVRWKSAVSRQGYLLFDCSGKPRPGYGSHSHADDLQFLLHDSRGPIFTDPGRFTYCTEFKAFFPWTRLRINPLGRFRRVYDLIFPDFMALTRRNWKEYFKRTLSHNTVSCDAGDQSGYERRRDVGGSVRLVRNLSAGSLIYLEGLREHRNSASDEIASRQYSHRRIMIGCHPDLWIIVDRVTSTRKHQWTSSFHVDMGCKISALPAFHLIEANGGLHQFFGTSLMDEDGGVFSIDDDWVSPVYNLKIPAKTVRIRSQKSSIAELVGIVYSGAKSDRRIERVEQIPVRDESGVLIRKNLVIHIIQDNVMTQVLINPDRLDCCIGNLRSDAAVASVSHQDGHLLEATVIRGQYLTVGDTSFTISGGADVLHQILSPR